jgi:parallel beta-helix repeat protein
MAYHPKKTITSTEHTNHTLRRGLFPLVAQSLNLVLCLATATRSYIRTRTVHATRTHSQHLFAIISCTLLLALALSSLAILRPVLHGTGYAQSPSTLNFQARLKTSSGAIAPDGTYNVEFKLYDDPTTGTELWTETRTFDTDPSDQHIQVRSGYLSVYLGDKTPFPSSIDWNDQHYLTMNIGGTDATPSWDGEMTPRIRLSSVPYAFAAEHAETATDAEQLEGRSADEFVQLSPSSQQTGGIDISGSGQFGSTIQSTGSITSTNGALVIQGSSDSSIAGNLAIGTTNPQVALDVDGGIRVGNSTVNLAGVIRWTGSDLEVYDGADWTSLTEGSGGSGGSGVEALNTLTGSLILQGTTNQVTVSDDGTDTITLALPQDIHAGAGVNFASVTTTGNISAGGNLSVTSTSTFGDTLTVYNQAGDALITADTQNSIFRVGGYSFESMEKLDNPSTLPVNTGLGVSFSPNRMYMTVAHSDSPHITIYKIDHETDTFTKLPNPAELPPDGGGSHSYDVAFSPDSRYMSVASRYSPQITVYEIDHETDTFTKLPDPADLPTDRGRGTAFSPDGKYISLAHMGAPYVSIYELDSATNTLTKLPNPTDLPANDGHGTAFSPDGNYMSVAHADSPYVTIYEVDSDTNTFTKVANPTDLPANDGHGTAFSPDGNYMSVAHADSPYVTIYEVDSDTNTFTKVANPTDLPAGTGNDVAFSPSGQYMSVAHADSPFITIYEIDASTHTFTKMDNPTVLPASTSNGIAWDPLSKYLATAHTNSPYITIYRAGSGQIADMDVSGKTKTTDLQVTRDASIQGSVEIGDALNVGFGGISSTGDMDIAGQVIFQNSINNTHAFQVQDASGDVLLNADTDNMRIGIGTDTPETTLHVVGNSTFQGIVGFWSQTDSPIALTVYNQAGDALITADTQNSIFRVGGYSFESMEKLDNPSTLPVNTGLGVSFSPNRMYMTVAHSDSPHITIYKIDHETDTFTKLPNPAELPPDGGGSHSYDVAFSPDSRYMSVASRYSPQITVYEIDHETDTFTKLPDPADLPTDRGRGTAFSPDGKYISLAHMGAPYVSIYELDSATNTLTKLPNPTDLPANDGHGTAFSPDGNYMSVAHADSPYVTIYEVDSDTNTFTKVANPTDLPANDGHGTAFSPDGNYMSVAHADSPYVTIYEVDSDTNTFTKVANPTDLPAGTGNDVAFSPSGQYMSVAHADSPFITIYEIDASTHTFTKMDNPTVLPASTSNGIAWDPLSKYLATAHTNSPYITIYRAGSGQIADMDVSGKISTRELYVSDSAIFQAGINSASLLQVQNALGDVLLNADTTNMRIGIGTDTPSYALDVVTSDAIAARFSGRVIGSDAVEDDEFITLGQGNTLYQAAGDYQEAGDYFLQGGNAFGAPAVLGTTDSEELRLITSGVTALTIDASRQVGIGTSSPQAKLDIVAGHIQAGLRVEMLATGPPSYDVIEALYDGGTIFAVDWQGNMEVAGTATFNGNVVVASGQSFRLTGSDTFPSSPDEGELYYRTDNNTLYLYNGTEWVDLADDGSGGTDSRTATMIVAADDSPADAKNSADYVTSGTSDQVEINQALTAAAGGYVYLHEGTYTVDDSIEIPNNTTLSGAGNSTVIRIRSSHDTHLDVVTAIGTNRTGQSVMNLKIDGNKDNQTSGIQRGVSFSGVGTDSGGTTKGVNVRNVTAVDFRHNGIYINNSKNGNVVNNVVSNSNSAGFHLNDIEDTTVTGNIAKGTGQHGVHLHNSDNNILSENVSVSNTINGIYLQASDHNIVSGNTTRDNERGFRLHSSSNNTVSANTATGNNTYGIALNSVSDNNSIVSNRIHDSGGNSTNNGIYISTDNNLIIGNNITDTSCTTNCYAINIFSGASNNYLSGNYYFGDGTNPATINDSGTDTVYSNQIGNNGAIINRQANSTEMFQLQASNGDVLFNADTENMRIGIGTDAPSYALDVVTSDDIAARFSGRVIGADAVEDDEFVTLGQMDDAIDSAVGSSGDILQGGNAFGALMTLGTTDNQALRFITNSTERMRILNSGEVGIGTDTPSHLLDVSGGTGIVARFSGRVIGAEASNTDEFVTLGQMNSAISGGGGSLFSDAGSYTYLTSTSDDFVLGASSIADGSLYMDVSANRLRLGNGTSAGELRLEDGSGTSTTLAPGLSSSNLTFTLPSNYGNSGQCIKSDGSGGWNFANCNTGSGSGGAITMQDTYDESGTPATIVTSSTSKDIIFRSGSGNNTTNMFQLQNASGNSIFSADTSNGRIVLGQASTLNGRLTFANSSNANLVSIVPGATSSTYTLTLPTSLGSQDQCLVDTTGNGVLGWADCDTGGGSAGVDSINTLDGSLTIQGTSNQITVSDDGSDTITLSLPQDINTTAAVEFGSLTTSGNVSVGGTLTVTNATTFNGDVVVASGQSFRLTGSDTFPSSPEEGELYYRTDNNTLYLYNGTEWVDLADEGSSGTDSRTATMIVAADDSPADAKNSADYVTSGTSDQVEINNALTAAAGGYVYLHEGTYTVDDSIEIPNNTTLAGAGSGTLITIPDSHDANIDVITNSDTTSGTSISIKDLRIDGNRDNQASGTQTGILLDSMGGGTGGSARQGANITNIGVDNFRTRGILLLSSSNNTLTNNTAGNNQIDFMLVNGASNNILTGNLAQGGGNSFVIFNSNNNTLTGNTALDAESSHYGFYLEDSDGNTLTGNTAMGNGGSGYLMVNSSDNVLTGNSAIENGGRGFSLSTGSGNNLISSNRIHDNESHGIHLFGTANNYNSITNNYITATAGENYAIYIESGEGTQLSNNRFGTGTNGVWHTDGPINDQGADTLYSNQIGNNGAIINRQADSTEMFQLQAANGDVLFNADTENMRIGIGTDAPSYALDVVTSDDIAARFSGRVIGADAVENDEFVTLGQMTDAIAAAGSGGESKWSEDGSDIYRLSGNVGIGTDSPSEGLTLGDGTNARNLLLASSGQATSGTQYSSNEFILQGSAWDEDSAQAVNRQVSLRVITGSGPEDLEPYRLAIKNQEGVEFITFAGESERLGVGSATPQAKLHVTGPEAESLFPLFLLDNFNNTDSTLLQNHSPDVGDDWEELDLRFVQGGSPSSTLEIDDNNVRAPGSDVASAHRNITEPPGEEYDIQAEIRVSGGTNRLAALGARLTPTGTENIDVDRYEFYLSGEDGGEWGIRKVVNGSSTTLATTPADGSHIGEWLTVRVEVRNNEKRLILLDGINDPVLVSTTDNEIEDKGRVGVGLGRGARMNNLEVTPSNDGSPTVLIDREDEFATALDIRSGVVSTFSVGHNGQLTSSAGATFQDSLGIGTTSPSNELTVSGNADITGSLGIGTASPQEALHIEGNMQLNGNIISEQDALHLTVNGRPFVFKRGVLPLNGNVYSGAWDDEVHKIDSEGNNIWAYDNHGTGGELMAVAVDPDGFVYSGGYSEELHKTNASGSNVWSYTGHSDRIHGVAVDDQGNVYSASRDNEVHKVDSSGTPVWQYTGHTDEMRAVAVDADGYVYTASTDGEVHKIDPDGRTGSFSTVGPNGWVYTGHGANEARAVAVDSDGYVYSGGTDNRVHKIDSSGNNVWEYTDHSHDVQAVAVDSDGFVYSGDRNGQVHKITDAGGGVWQYTEHTDRVAAVAVDPDGFVYTASRDNEVHKISSTGSNVWIYDGHGLGNFDDRAYAVAVDPGLYGAFPTAWEEEGTAEGWFGVGTANPSYALEVQTLADIAARFSGRVIGADAVEDDEFVTLGQMTDAIAAGGGGGESKWTEDGSDIYRLSGNVGIGTDNPQATLDVSGSAQFSDTVTFNGDVVVASGQSLALEGGDTASRPSSPTEGMLYYDTDTDRLLVYANGKWQADRSTTTVIVAPEDASQTAKDSADFVVPVTSDEAQNTINSAIATLPSSGGTVYLLEGTYTVSGSIELPNNTTLSGAGSSTVIRLVDAHNASVDIITNSDVSTGSNVTVRDLTIDGNRGEQGAGMQNGVLFAGLEGGSIERTIITGMRVYAIHILESSRISMTQNTIQDNTWGVHVESSAATDNLIESNIFVENETFAIQLTEDMNTTVTNNRIIDTGLSSTDHSIYAEAATNARITNNYITDSAGEARAIYLEATTNVYLAHNTFGTGAEGVWHSDGPVFTEWDIGTVIGGQTMSATSDFLFRGTDSSSAFHIQNAAGDMLFGVDSSAGSVLFGEAGATDGRLVIGNASNSNTITIQTGETSASYTLTLPTSAPSNGQCLVAGSGGQLSWGSCGGGGGSLGLQTVKLTPEFAGGTLYADGTDNSGMMNASYEGGLSAAEGRSHTFYEWSSGESSAQHYDVIINHPLASTFSGTNEFETSSWKVWTYVDNLSTGALEFTIEDADGTVCVNSEVVTPSTAGTWEQITLSTNPNTACDFAPNDRITIKVRLISEDSTSDKVRLGAIEYEYMP